MNYFDKIVNKSLFTKIGFYLIIFFILRLYHITNPPLEVAHNWRQTTVAMVARNFHETNSNIFYPRVDFAGTKTGITGMEFPLLNYLIYLVALIFDYNHWYGRLINLIVSSIGIYFFDKLLRKYFDKKIAFYASVVLLFSLWFTFSRKIMPDTFSFSFMIMALYYGTNYFENKKHSHLLLYALFCLLGILTKLPSCYILIIFSLFLFNEQFALKYKIIFSSVTLFILIPVCYWYFYWVPYLTKTFDFWHFYMGDSMLTGARELSTHLFDTCFHFFESAIKYVGFAFYIYGVYHAFNSGNKKLVYVFILCSLTFFIIMLKAGFAFHHHNYYIIPFIPVMSLLCSYGIYSVKKTKYQVVLLLIIFIESISNHQNDFFIKPKDYQIYNLEKDLNSIGNKNDFILINSEKWPTPMYFAHRKGEITYNDSLLNNAYLAKHKAKGYKFIVILKQSFGTEIQLDLPKKINNPYYAIYQL